MSHIQHSGNHTNSLTTLLKLQENVKHDNYRSLIMEINSNSGDTCSWNLYRNLHRHSGGSRVSKRGGPSSIEVPRGTVWGGVSHPHWWSGLCPLPQIFWTNLQLHFSWVYGKLWYNCLTSIGCFLDNLGLAQYFVPVDFIFYILDGRRARIPRWIRYCTDARDQNRAVWLVGCVWKFNLHRIQLRSIQCKFLVQVSCTCATAISEWKVW